MGTRISGRATFGGLASGLDTSAIIEGLMQIERQPLQRIQSRRSEVESQRSLIRQLNSRLLALRDAARGLDNRNSNQTSAALNEEFFKYTSSSTNEDVVRVKAGFGAAPGDIQVRVDQLARGSRRFSTPLSVASPDQTVDDVVALAQGQSITISLADGDPDAPDEEDRPTSITITADDGDLSLAQLRSRINTSSDNGGKVRADILQISEGQFRLVMSSAGTGEDNQLSVTGDLALAAETADDLAQSASFQIFGQTITRQSNDVDDVLTGITLELRGVAERDENDEPISETVSIQPDTEAMSSAIEDFIDAYNGVVSFIDAQSKYDETTKSSGPLSGDFMVREVQRRLREIVSRGYKFEESPNNPFAPGGVDANGRPRAGGAISAIGIRITGNGRLELDRNRFEEALAQDPSSVRDFLSGVDGETVHNQGEIDRINAYNAAHPDDPKPVPDPYTWDDGFFTAVGRQLEEIVRSGDGLLAQRDSQFATRLKDIDASIDRFNLRLADREELLVQRFTALERIVSTFQNQQGFLGRLG